jgi:hypothetical protein
VGTWLLRGAVLIGTLTFGVRVADAQGTTLVIGCYIAKPALTYSATGEPERGDTSWAYAQLSPKGVARRPLLHANVDRRSSWRIEDDTLHVTFSDGLAGWRLQLVRAPQGWTGLATYLSDARVVGQPAFRQPITFARRSCAAPA